MTSNARVFHSVSCGSDLSVMPALLARIAISSTFCVVDMNNRMPIPFLRSRPFLPIVLVQADLGLAGTQHHAEQRPFVFPPLLDREAERFVKGHALLQIVDDEAGNDRADPLPSSRRTLPL